MEAYQHILDKLNTFILKYYTKILIKGILLFLCLGLIFLLIILGIEHFLWLNSLGRLILFLLFIIVELFLIFKYIVSPLVYLFRLKDGITKKQAAVIIGEHFPEVGDKLYNLLDLKDDTIQSELLLASIDQRSNLLGKFLFSNAIDYKENSKYGKYLVIPILSIVFIWVSGNFTSFFGSYDRVIHYDMAYEPPAPFRFYLLSSNLKVLESDTYMVEITTEGAIRPESISIVIHGKEFLLQQKNGVAQYTFLPPLENTDFYFIANGVRSRLYSLYALKTPSILDFSMVLNYPSYIKRVSDTIKGTGNATFPEGTNVRWNITGKNTESIKLASMGNSATFLKDSDEFRYSKRVYAAMSYILTTSNENVRAYESLGYRFNVIKDEYPSIEVSQIKDSINPNISYYSGEATDDYKLVSIVLVCYPDNDKNEVQRIEIVKPNSNFSQFYYTYPSGLILKKEVPYSFYFEVLDNDAIHGGKKVKSQIFSFELLDDNQLKNKELETQNALINTIDKSLERFKEQKESLKEISKEQKEKSALSFSDKNKIQDFLKKQSQQERLMKKFSKQLKESLNKGNKDDQLNKLLQQRLQRREIEARKNEKLLKELQEVADKINKEELAKRLEEVAKNQNNSERSLEQLLELTKRYYVREKASQLAKDLEKLSEKQKQESQQRNKASEQEQEKLNVNFLKLTNELDELLKDNNALKKPLDLKADKVLEMEIKKDQEDALNALKKAGALAEVDKMNTNDSKSSKKQKSASQKIKQLSEQLSKSVASAKSGSSIMEDAEMLRQILDNLIRFSLEQEKLYDRISKLDKDVSQISKSIRKQQQLGTIFRHVDDSLFALSLRRAELSDFVNEQITGVYYNIDKSLERFAERQLPQGLSSQKYILTAANGLAAFLADILDNMQESIKFSGSGKGQKIPEFQLADIIKGQGELQGKMERIGKEGKGGKNGQNGVKGKKDDGKSATSGLGEKELEEIYEIYKEQQIIKNRLEQQLQDFMLEKDKLLARKLAKLMDDFQNDLLENGITQRTISKANHIKYELLKLENATLKQGQKQKRESISNKDRFQNPITTKPSVLENHQDQIEILDRQVLPLHRFFQGKVKDYFKRND